MKIHYNQIGLTPPSFIKMRPRVHEMQKWDIQTKFGGATVSRTVMIKLTVNKYLI